MKERSCDACGITYEYESPRSKFCRSKECTRSRARARKLKQRGGAVVEFPAQSPAALEELDLVVVTVRRLEAAGRLDTTEGQGALLLAKRLASSSQDSGSGVASLHKEYRSAMVEALAGAEQVDDPIDRRRAQVQARRLSVVS